MIESTIAISPPRAVLCEGKGGGGGGGRRKEGGITRQDSHPEHLYLWACFNGRFLNNHPLTLARLREPLSI